VPAVTAGTIAKLKSVQNQHPLSLLMVPVFLPDTNGINYIGSIKKFASFTPAELNYL